MEKDNYLNKQQTVLLQKTCIFALYPPLEIEIDDAVTFIADDWQYIVSVKEHEKNIAQGVMAKANEKELRLYVKDLTFSHRCLVTLPSLIYKIVPVELVELTGIDRKTDIEVFLQSLAG
jgi:hypothetical protein